MNRKGVKTELRDAGRIRTRLKSHAKRLSDDDLVQVFRLREESRTNEGGDLLGAQTSEEADFAEPTRTQRKAGAPKDDEGCHEEAPRKRQHRQGSSAEDQCMIMEYHCRVQ